MVGEWDGWMVNDNFMVSVISTFRFMWVVITYGSFANVNYAD